MEVLRKCKQCGLEALTKEELKLFVKDEAYKHGRTLECKKCGNKRKIKERQIRQEQKQMIALQSLGAECVGCGLKATKNNMVVFDFHHIDKTTKEGSIADMLAEGRPLEVLMEEVSKCALLCSNCHRLHHKKYGY